MPIEPRRARAARNGRRPWYPPLLLPAVLLVLPIVWVLGKGRESTARAGYGWLDPAAIEFELPTEGTDPRWEVALRSRIERFGSAALDDGRRITELREELEALSFVAETDDPRVVWPVGIEFPIRVRLPRACVVVGEGFLAVDEEGVVLDGPHATPPRVGRGFLPVIAPVDDGRFDRVAPGDRLTDEADLDALAIADSMWTHLPPPALELLGRTTIDAREARRTSVTCAGAVIALEETRAIAFGRSPREGHVASLPVELKWQHVVDGLLTLSGPEARDWSELDARMDVATFEWRGVNDEAR